jgi:hypothetical protein
MSSKNQSLHDWVLDNLANTKGFHDFAANNSYLIAKNHDDEKTLSIKIGNDEAWPDIIVYDPKLESGNVFRLGEVETGKTVTLEHATGHWDVYGKATPTFVLAVPEDSVDAAKKIIAELHVKCDLWAYKVLYKDGKPDSIEFH